MTGAYALVRTYGEDGFTARLVPLIFGGLIHASSMVMLYSAHRRTPVPVLAPWPLHRRPRRSSGDVRFRPVAAQR